MFEVVQVKMKNDTIRQLDKIKNIVNAPSRSDAVRRAVGITDTIIHAIEQGNRILIESTTGKQKQLLISGLFEHESR